MEVEKLKKLSNEQLIKKYLDLQYKYDDLIITMSDIEYELYEQELTDNKSLGYLYKLEQRIKELEKIEEEHKKENGKLRERNKELEEKYKELSMDYNHRCQLAIDRKKEIEELIKKYETRKENCNDIETEIRLDVKINTFKESLKE